MLSITHSKALVNSSLSPRVSLSNKMHYLGTCGWQPLWGRVGEWQAPWSWYNEGCPRQCLWRTVQSWGKAGRGQLSAHHWYANTVEQFTKRCKLVAQPSYQSVWLNLGTDLTWQLTVNWYTNVHPHSGIVYTGLWINNEIPPEEFASSMAFLGSSEIDIYQGETFQIGKLVIIYRQQVFQETHIFYYLFLINLNLISYLTIYRNSGTAC